MGTKQSKQERETSRLRDETARLEVEIARLKTIANDYIPGYVPGTSRDIYEFPKTLHVGLYGNVGVGKTSLINSIMRVFHDNFNSEQDYQVPNTSAHGTGTIYRRRVEVIKSFILVDNRGILPEHWTYEAVHQELIKQLEGRRGYNYPIDWKGTSQPPENEEQIEVGDRIFCTVFVFDANTELDLSALKDLMDKLNIWQGSFPIAVITQIDQCYRTKIENLRSKLNAGGITNIYEVENIHEGHPELSKQTKLTLLQLVIRCMTDGDRIYVFRHGMRDGHP